MPHRLSHPIGQKSKAEKEAEKRAKKVSTVKGELPEGTARVDLAPGFLKKGREGFAGLFTFLLQQAAEQSGFPPGLLFQLFGAPRVGSNGGNGDDDSVVVTGRENGENGENGEEEEEEFIVTSPLPGAAPLPSTLPATLPSLPSAVVPEVGTLPEIGNLPVLPTVPGLPGFMEDIGRGPNVAAAVAIPAAASLFGSLLGPGGLLRGGPKEPGQIVGGQGGNITPIFPDLNQQQLRLFLQLLQQLSTGGPSAALAGTGGPAAALGPNPHTADATGFEPVGPGSTITENITDLPSIGGAEQIDKTIPVLPPIPGGGFEAGGTTVNPGGRAPPPTGGPPPQIDFRIGMPIDIEPGEKDRGGDGGVDIPIDIEPGEKDGGGGGEIDPDASDQTQQDQLQNFLDQIGSGGLADFAKFFSLPTFEGPFTTPATDLQRQALGASSEFLGTDLGERNRVSQNALQELIRTGGEGAPGVDPLGKLTRETSADPTLNEFLQTGGGRFDLSPQFSALEAINKRRLDEQVARQREQFGVLGGRFGTDIAKGRGELESRFLEQESGQRAEIAGQSFREQQQRRLASLGLASGRDISREQLGVQARGQDLGLQQLLQNVFAGQQTRRLQGLGLGEQQRQTDIAARGQRGREITEGFRLGEAERQIGDTAIQRQLAEFARTQGSLLPMLLDFFSQGVGQEELILPPE